MVVNLAVLRSLPELSRTSGRLEHPSRSPGHRGSSHGSFGHPGRQATPSRRDLIIIRYKY